MTTENPKGKDTILSPEKMAEFLGRPLKEVQADLKNVETRGVLANSLFYSNTELQNKYGDVTKLNAHLDEVASTLESKSGFFNRLKQGGNWVWEKTKAVLGNKWVQRVGLVVLAAAAIYLGIKYLPSWDQVMAWVQRLRGAGAANTAATGIGAPAYGAAPVTEKLVTGAVTPTTSANTYGSALNLLKAMEQSPGSVPTIVAGAK